MTEEIIQKTKKRAFLFCIDNYTSFTPQELLLIETAMLIGASIAEEEMGKQLAKETNEVIN
jgi:hypothetical protein